MDGPLLLKKCFYDNNNITHKTITSILGEFGTHFIGIDTFFKKMVNLTLFLFSIFIKISFFIFSGLREKQDKVDFGNDREDNIIEDLNTLSDKIKSNVNSLNQ